MAWSTALFLAAMAQTAPVEPIDAQDDPQAVVEIETPAVEPRAYGLTGDMAERFGTIWNDLTPEVRQRVESEARRLWREDLTDEEKEAVRAAARTLYADLTPRERRDLKEARARRWLDMPQIDRIRARTNETLSFAQLPAAYQNGFRAEALKRVDPSAADELFAEPAERPVGRDILDRLAYPDDRAPTSDEESGESGAGERDG